MQGYNISILYNMIYKLSNKRRKKYIYRYKIKGVAIKQNSCITYNYYNNHIVIHRYELYIMSILNPFHSLHQRPPPP